MRKNKTVLDVFVLSGFISSFFYGFLNPLYISVILSRLDPRVIAVGSFMSSGFPVLIGAVLGNQRLFKRMYAVLPWVMVFELVAGCAAALVAAFDLAVYYLVSMAIIGVFSTSVVFLLQKIKEKRYRASRASFDRRYAMADALGSGAGAGVSICGNVRAQGPASDRRDRSAPDGHCLRPFPPHVPSGPVAGQAPGRRGAAPMAANTIRGGSASRCLRLTRVHRAPGTAPRQRAAEAAGT